MHNISICRVRIVAATLCSPAAIRSACCLADTPVRFSAERHATSGYTCRAAQAGTVEQVLLPLAPRARISCSARTPIARRAVLFLALARLAFVWTTLLFVPCAGKLWLAKVLVAVPALVGNHCRRAVALFDARSIVKVIPARAAVAFHKRVLESRAKCCVRTFLFRAVRVASVAILFDVPAVLLPVTARALGARLKEPRTFASQPIFAFAVHQKRTRFASRAHFITGSCNFRCLTRRQGGFAPRRRAKAVLCNAGSPAHCLPSWDKTFGSAC